MKRNSLIKSNDRDNLLRILLLNRKIEHYGTGYKLSQTDIDNILKIEIGYSKLIERVRDYEKNR